MKIYIFFVLFVLSAGYISSMWYADQDGRLLLAQTQNTPDPCEGMCPEGTVCDPVAGTCTDPAQQQLVDQVTCKDWIKLNTDFPFIWNCINITKSGRPVDQISTSDGTVSIIREDSIFPVLLTALSKIVMSLILLGCFILLIVGGFELITWQSVISAGDGMGKIKVVLAALALLGTASVILKVVNPNFFGDWGASTITPDVNTVPSSSTNSSVTTSSW